MENDQVTIALQAAGLKGRLGRAMLLVSVALDAPAQLVILRAKPGEALVEQVRMGIGETPLSAKGVDMIQAWVSDEIYTSLLYWKGVQAEFESLP